MLPRSTADLYRAEQARVLRTLLASRRLWDGARTPRQAQALIPRLALLLSTSMVAGAGEGAAAVGPALDEAGHSVEPVAMVATAAFGLSASDGRPLASLLASPVLASRTSTTAGRATLDRIVHTQVSDAVRGGSAVGITARPRVGWVRMVNPPCCSDCALLAGKFFRHNEGFRRHPRCDCVHRPTHELEPPDGYAIEIPPDQITDLTAGQRAALDEGADLSRVVNAYRSEIEAGGGRASVATRQRMTTTTELASGGTRRLTPDGINEIAAHREEAIALLRQHGYLL